MRISKPSINSIKQHLISNTADQILGVSSMQSLKMAVDQPGPSYWDGNAPPSSVLGVGAKVPSSVFGIGSLIALGMSYFC